MALIQSASAERRPAMATLSDAQAVVESLLQHTLGLQPDLSDLPPATVALIGQAVVLLGISTHRKSTQKLPRKLLHGSRFHSSFQP